MFPLALPPSSKAMPTLGLSSALLLVSFPIIPSLKPSQSVHPTYEQSVSPVGTGGSHKAPACLVSQRLSSVYKNQSSGGNINLGAKC